MCLNRKNWNLQVHVPSKTRIFEQMYFLTKFYVFWANVFFTTISHTFEKRDWFATQTTIGAYVKSPLNFDNWSLLCTFAYVFSPLLKTWLVCDTNNCDLWLGKLDVFCWFVKIPITLPGKTRRRVFYPRKIRWIINRVIILVPSMYL